jgi:hypothetical protein
MRQSRIALVALAVIALAGCAVDEADQADRDAFSAVLAAERLDGVILASLDSRVSARLAPDVEVAQGLSIVDELVRLSEGSRASSLLLTIQSPGDFTTTSFVSIDLDGDYETAVRAWLTVLAAGYGEVTYRATEHSFTVRDPESAAASPEDAYDDVLGLLADAGVSLEGLGLRVGALDSPDASQALGAER